MSPAKRWFDRAFELGQGDDRLPATLARLRSTPDRLEALISGVSPALLGLRVENAWSMLENVGHLQDLEALSERRLDDFEAAAGTLHPADLENRRTWDANHNARPPADVLRGFREARAHFAGRIESMSAEGLARTITHPRLNQPMRVVDLAFFMAEHDDHHLERIRELILVTAGTKA